MIRTIIKPILRPLYNHYTAGENIESLGRKILELRKKKLYPIPPNQKKNFHVHFVGIP